MSETSSLENRIILVTGAGSGIGKAVSRAASLAGATVVLCGRTQKALEQTYDEIIALGGVEPLIATLNLETCGYAEIKAIADAIETSFGRLDGLVINAAQLGEHTPIKLASPQKFAKTIHINFNSHFLLLHTLLPLIEASEAPVCLLTGDEASTGRAFGGAYGIAKASQTSLFAMLHEEMGDDIRVHRVEPGPTSTSLRLQTFPGEETSNLASADSIARLYIGALDVNCQLQRGSVIRR
jgi:NAD(P)-dependent dehydrogenase (short-subunit alcohol dehydrogenase family)